MPDRTYTFRSHRKTYEIRSAEGDYCDYVFDEIFARNAYPVLPCLQNAKTIVDVGANIGCAALWFHHSYRKANIYCFEPSPKAYKYLKRNTARISRIHAFHFGLYNRDMAADINAGIASSSTNSIFNSVLNGSATEPITLRKASRVLNELEIDTIDILKIDTEGAEVPILRDMKRWLNKTSAVYLEYHSERDRCEIAALLEPRFTLYACNVEHPHRGNIVYLASDLVSEKTDFDRFIIQRTNA